jgi:predicted nucleic acid-binding protein
MKKVLVDTNVLIDYSKGYSDNLKDLFLLREKSEVELFVNTVIVAEFFTDINLEKKEKYIIAREYIQLFRSLPMSASTGYIAGELLRKKRVLHLGDALIAAHCLEGKLYLATENGKHFRKVPRLLILS